MDKQDVDVKILALDRYQIQIKKDGVLSYEQLKDFGQNIQQICEFAEYWGPYLQHDWTELREPYEDGSYNVGTDLRTWIEIPIDRDLSEDEKTRLECFGDSNHDLARIVKQEYTKQGHDISKINFDTEYSYAYITAKDKQTAEQFINFFNETYIQPKLNQIRKIFKTNIV